MLGRRDRRRRRARRHGGTLGGRGTKCIAKTDDGIQYQLDYCGKDSKGGWHLAGAAGSFRAERHTVPQTVLRIHPCLSGTHDRQTQQIQVAEYIGFDTPPLNMVLAVRSRGAPAGNRQDDVERSWSSQLVVDMRMVKRATRLFE